ncbi:MAG: hypothetical protein Q7K03_00985, partial [Dehalococcoidia bacterium]|nr:hypothetical protein [Dehalococcoidia bacterium]
PIVLSADDYLESVLGRVMDYDWHLETLPVVDSEGKLVGEVHRTVLRDLAAEAFAPRVRASARQSTAV